MKTKTSKKSILEKNKIIIKIGYCSAQSLLSCVNPFAYSAGANGWDCDYYNINGIIISTGYAPIGKKINYNILKRYELEAEKLYSLSWDEKKEKINMLLNNFIKEVI